MPPEGGFEPIRFARRLPKRGPTGLVLVGIVGALMTNAWMNVFDEHRERRDLDREKTWARIHIAPLLEAETDRDIVRRLDAVAAREAEIMKDVPGFVPGDLRAPVPGLAEDGSFQPGVATPVYYTDRYVPQTIVYIPDGDSGLLEAGWFDNNTHFKYNAL